MSQKSIVISIACFLFIGIFVFLVWSTVLYYQQKDDYNKAWQNGYDTALSAKDEYVSYINKLEQEKITLSTELTQTKASVESLTASNNENIAKVEQLIKDKESLQLEVNNLTSLKTENEQTISDLNLNIENYQAKISNLTTDIENKQNTITQLESDIDYLEENIEMLQNNATDNEATIAELTQQKSALETQITNLNAQITSKIQEINTLNSTITSLENMVAKLQSTNDIQSQTITNLNNQIISLNTQISNLTLQINNNSGIVSSLQSKITQLENSIAYYEEYIAGLENGSQIVITAEFNGSVYNVQVINKGSKLSLIEPTSTDYVIFNYWEDEEGNQVDLSTKTFDESTKLIANVTYKFDVNFYVDNASFNDQIIIKNGYATEPTVPTKTGYEFDGWSLDGQTVIEVSETPITKNTIFYAVFTKQHTVQFNDGTQVISTQSVRNGEFAEDVDIEDTPYKVFNGWTYNGSLVNVPSYAISTDIVFTASYTYKFDVTFKVEEQTHNSQIIASGNFATAPTAPTKTGYTFKGWSLDGQNVVNLNSTPITATTTFIAIFEINSYTVTFDTGDTNTTTTQQVNYNGSPVEPTAPTKTGYTFKGWSLDGQNVVNLNRTPITATTTFIAIFEINTYTVTFDTGDISTTTTQQVNYNSSPVEPATPSKDYCAFIGWSLTGSDIVSVTSQVITDNTTFYAIFEREVWVVTFMADDALFATAYYVIAENKGLERIPNATKNGYVFVGWSLDNQNIIDINNFVPSQDTTLYAIFKEDISGSYQLNFDATLYGISPIMSVGIEEECYFDLSDNNVTITANNYNNVTLSYNADLSVLVYEAELSIQSSNMLDADKLQLTFNYNYVTQSWDLTSSMLLDKDKDITLDSWSLEKI